MSQVKEFYYDIDLVTNSIRNARLHPITAVEKDALVYDIDDSGIIVYVTDEELFYGWFGNRWVPLVASTFLALADTPHNYIGNAGKVLRVNSTETGLEFHLLTKTDVGLPNVDNTSDANKPISTAQQAALDLKANKSITISASGNGITGGGSLAANRTFSLDFDYLNNLYAPLSSVITIDNNTNNFILTATGTSAINGESSLRAITNGLEIIASGSGGASLALNSTATGGHNWSIFSFSNVNTIPQAVAFYNVTADKTPFIFTTDDWRFINPYILKWTVDDYGYADVGTVDVGIGWDASGRLQINNGTAGTYADLKARTYHATRGLYAERGDGGAAFVGLNNTAGGKEWYIASVGSSNEDPGSLMFNNETDGLSPMSLSSDALKLKVDTGLKWTNDSTTDTVTYTVGLNVDATNRLQINDGTYNSFADLKLRNLFLSTIANDDALGQVIVRDSTTGQLKYRTVGSLVSGDSTLWNGYANDFAAGIQDTISGPALTDGILGMAEDFVVYRYNNTAIAQYLGLNSAAYTDSGDYATAAQGANADTAYGWGNHASAGYLTTISGITAGGELSGTYANPSLVNNAVITKVLTGLNITGGTLLSTDSILTAFGKVQNQINSLVGGMQFVDFWNASTNSPAIPTAVGNKGKYYITQVAGSTNIDGVADWQVGDWIVSNGTVWSKIDNTDAVISVNGQTGIVSLSTSHILEGSGLYFTDVRARAALSFTAGSGGYNSTTGVITIPTNTNQLTNGASFITLASLSASSPLSYNNTTGVFSISQATTSTNGYLSSTDWNTFNNKQNALTNPITGTGTANTIAKFTGSTTLGNSIITESGSRIRVNGNGIEINGPATSYKELLFLTDLGARFNAYVIGAETGSNAGSNYYFSRYNDAGAYIDDIYSIQRATGNISFNYDISTNTKITTPNTISTQYNFATGTAFASYGSGHTYVYSGTTDFIVTSNTGAATLFSVSNTGTGNLAGALTTLGLTVNTGTVVLNALSNGAAGAFLVINSGTVALRTAAQVLSDIGAAPATGGAYLPLTAGIGSPLTGTLFGVASSWTGDAAYGYNNAVTFGGFPYRFKIARDSAGDLPVYFDDEYDNALSSINFRMRTTGTLFTPLVIKYNNVNTARLNVNGATDNASYALNVTGVGNFSGLVGATGGFNSTAAVAYTATGRATSFQDVIRATNTTADMLLTIEGNTGGVRYTGSTAYASIVGSASATPLEFGTSDIIRGRFTASGGFELLGSLLGTTASFSGSGVFGVQTTINGSGSGYYQAATILKSSTTNNPELRALGIYMFNEGTDATWFSGNAYNDASRFIISRKSGTSFEDAAADYSNAFFILSSTGAATFSGSVSGTTAAFSSTGLFTNVTTTQGANPYFQWTNAIGTRLSYIQHNAVNLIYNADVGSHVFNQAISTASTVTTGAAGVYVYSSATRMESDGTNLYLRATGNTYLNTANSAYSDNGGVVYGNGFSVPNGGYYKAIRTSGLATINVLGIEAGTDNTVMVASNYFKLRNTGTGDAANTFTVDSSGNSVTKNDATINGIIYAYRAASNTLLTGGSIYFSGGYSALRIGTDNSWNIDNYNGGSYVNALNIVQAGAATFISTVTATGFIVSSDLTLKNITSRVKSADGIDFLSWNWKDGRDGFIEHYGYGAQEVEKVLPSTVYKLDTKSIAIQEVQAYKIMKLEQRVEELETLLNRK